MPDVGSQQNKLVAGADVAVVCSPEQGRALFLRCGAFVVDPCPTVIGIENMRTTPANYRLSFVPDLWVLERGRASDS